VWARRRDRLAATRFAAWIGAAFGLLFVVAGVAGALALRNALYAWYAVLGTFLLRQSWSQAREAGGTPPGPNVEVVPAA
jgi:hypothetical protein